MTAARVEQVGRIRCYCGRLLADLTRSCSSPEVPADHTIVRGTVLPDGLNLRPRDGVRRPRSGEYAWNARPGDPLTYTLPCPACPAEPQKKLQTIVEALWLKRTADARRVVDLTFGAEL